MFALHCRTVTKASGTLSAEFTGLSRPGAEYETSVRTQVGSEVSEPASATFRISELADSFFARQGLWNSPIHQSR